MRSFRPDCRATAVLSYEVAGMDVYLIPLGADRYGLFSHLSPIEADVGEAPSTGVLGRARARLRRFLAQVEHGDVAVPGEDSGAPATAWRGAVLRWLARRVAEQRLLWRLRGETSVTLARPDDCPEPLAVELVRRRLQRDAARHRVWLIVDGLAFLASGLLMLLPGPNLVAYYFAFTTAGHYLSFRGARHGRRAVRWDTRAEPALSDLRQVLGLPAAERDRRLQDIADQLNLPALPAFVARARPRTA